MTRAIVCGGRDYRNGVHLHNEMNKLHTRYKFTCIIEGGARGADELASCWADYNQIPKETYPAQWKRYGRSAGRRRNKQMIEEGKPDIVIAFPGGPGTRNMIIQATQARLLVEVVK